MSGTVLLTGGTGYIGSHCAVALLQAGYHVILVDNLSNSKSTAEDAIKKVVTQNGDLSNAAGACADAAENVAKDVDQRLQFYHVNLEDDHSALPLLRAIFQVHQDIVAVIHLAAFKSVPESVGDPIRYYKNNLGSLMNLLQVMDEFQLYRLIFSSSATVYAPNIARKSVDESPMTAFHQQHLFASDGSDGQGLDETAKLGPTNPYGRTKLFGEQICEDMAKAWALKPASKNNVQVVALRYGNPVNSHPSGLLPETPVGAAMNLFNVCMEVLQGRRLELVVFGNDYPTPDGTGVRDYIHVVDLAEAHVATLNKMLGTYGAGADGKNFEAINVGIGRGFSVLEMVSALEKIHGRQIPVRFENRRPGDVASVIFDVSKAERLLGWSAKFQTISALCQATSVVVPTVSNL